jgi:hypothetical protein
MSMQPRRSVAGFFLLSLATFVAGAAPPSLEELWTLVQTQQEQLKTLSDELSATRAELAEAVGKIDQTERATLDTSARIAAVDAKVEATAEVLEEATGTGSTSDDSLYTTNVPQAAGSVGSAGGRWGPISGRTRSSAGTWAERTTLGGYGELHYNSLQDNATAFDGAADGVNRADFHRFVLFASHTFNSWLRFASEVEVEHSLIGDSQPGEVALELAWLEADIHARHHVRAGIDILPVGLLNLTHEPNTFYGVERNPIETEIIPSSWTEAALGFWGELGGGFSYNAYVHSGLKMATTGGSAFRPRAGRLKVAEADDQDVAFLGRLIYSGHPGLEIAATFDYQADYTGTADAAEADAWLVETHVDYRHHSGFGLRALYARWELGSDLSAGVDPGLVNADSLQGWYVEPAYRFSTANYFPGELGLFARYQQWDQRNQLTGAAFRFERFDGITAGVNYWPHPQVVFKFDAQWQDADGPVDRELDGFNLGLGYQF